MNSRVELDQGSVEGWPAPCSCGALYKQTPRGRWVITHFADGHTQRLEVQQEAPRRASESESAGDVLERMKLV